jgi:hypothetical protein
MNSQEYAARLQEPMRTNCVRNAAADLSGVGTGERIDSLERELAVTIERLSKATDFCLGQMPRLPKHWSNKVTVSLRSDSTTPIWAVVWNGNCLAKDGKWEYEPSPSRRDEAFLARCRFNSLDEAWAAAQAAMEGTDGGAA